METHGSFPSMGSALRHLWRTRELRIQLLWTVPCVILCVACLARFLLFIEQRPGVVLHDPILALFSAVNLTWFTFSVIYCGLVGGIFLLLRSPDHLLVALQSYCVMVLFRMAAMYALPLQPPAGMIPLQDPFVEYFGTGSLLTKDLFFSGHTATLFILMLSVPGRTAKLVFLLCTASVGGSVLLQHVHYTVDVLCAPAFAYSAYRCVMLVRRNVFKSQVAPS